MLVGPGRRTLPFPESGDGLFGVEAVTEEDLDGVTLDEVAFDGAGLKGVAIDGIGGAGLVGWGGIAGAAFAGAVLNGVVFGGVSFAGAALDGVVLDGVACAFLVDRGMVMRVGRSFGEVGGDRVMTVWVGSSGGCASSLWDSGEGLRSEVVARRTRGGSVLRRLNRGDGLLTMSELNWKGSGGREGRDDREGSELLLLGSELLRLKSGLGTRSGCDPKVNMGGAARSVMSTSGFSGAGSTVWGFLYW
jgi:hypothetical protein